MTCLEELFGVERFTNKFLHVPSSQEYDGHHSHQHPGEDETKSDAAVEKSRQALRYRTKYRRGEMGYVAVVGWEDWRWPKVSLTINSVGLIGGRGEFKGAGVITGSVYFGGHAHRTKIWILICCSGIILYKLYLTEAPLDHLHSLVRCSVPHMF